MDRLSPEIIDMVLDHLIPPELRDRRRNRKRDDSPWSCATLAVISRTWQYLVEKRLFREAHIDGTTEVINEFATIYKQPYRQSALRTLDMNIAYDCACEFCDVPVCGHAYDATIGTLIHLCRKMDQWGPVSTTLGQTQPGVRLNLKVETSRNGSHTYPPWRFPEDTLVVWNNTEAARRITGFSAGKSVHYTTACQLLNLFPNLRHLELEMEVNNLDNYAYRHDMLVEALVKARTSLPRLEELHLVLVSLSTFKVSEKPIKISGKRSGTGLDNLSEAIRLLSQAAPLRKLHLSGFPVSIDLLQNCQLPGEERDTATWPLLEEMIVDFPSLTPSNEWYFAPYPRPPEPNPPRLAGGSINTKTFNPLQVALARALWRMPSLRHASFYLYRESAFLSVGAVNRAGPRVDGGRVSDFGFDDREIYVTARVEDARMGCKRLDVALCRRIESRIEAVNGVEGMYAEDSLWKPTPEIISLWKQWVAHEEMPEEGGLPCTATGSRLN